MAGQRGRIINSLADLLAHEEEIDREICGIDLANGQATRLAARGAHDADPTHYFVLDELFSHFSFSERTHLLDVGCGTGRVLAHFLHRGYPGRITGIELDPQLAYVARSWAENHDRVHVIEGSVLEADLSPYTDFYLFNPFEPGILQQFIEAVERQVERGCTLVHMSDNGDAWRYVGRDGWTEVGSGEVFSYRNARGKDVRVYECPQHYTVWRYKGFSD